MLFTNINFLDPKSFLDGIKISSLKYIKDAIEKHNMVKLNGNFTDLFCKEVSGEKILWKRILYYGKVFSNKVYCSWNG